MRCGIIAVFFLEKSIGITLDAAEGRAAVQRQLLRSCVFHFRRTERRHVFVAGKMGGEMELTTFSGQGTGIVRQFRLV